MRTDATGLDVGRSVVIGLISFLSLIDLFGSQALLPVLTRHYQVDPATMGFAVNSSTIGMAVAGIGMAIFSNKIDRKRGIWMSLVLLAIPTSLLSIADNVAIFAALRIVQGIFMSAAFTLTMAYLAEECNSQEAVGAMAAYITGNVASNLVGRIMAANFADLFGLANSFYLFALLNLSGAALVYFCISQTPTHQVSVETVSPFKSMLVHLQNRALLASFAIGFIILFAFVGVFTYVNFVLSDPPFVLPVQKLGLVYLVFLPSMITTPVAGQLIARLGILGAFLLAMGVAIMGMALLMAVNLISILFGLTLVAIGLFCAQAVVTGFVGQAATHDRTTASGIYLSSYYLGGLAGSIILGQIFDLFGWAACVFAVILTILFSCALSLFLILPADEAVGKSRHV